MCSFLVQENTGFKSVNEKIDVTALGLNDVIERGEIKRGKKRSVSKVQKMCRHLNYRR